MFLVDDSYVLENLLDWPINWRWANVKHLYPDMPPTQIFFQNADCFFLDNK
jgi:hypothetical protein